MRAKRAGEQAEREWRKKEAHEMRQKAETEATLKAARSQQMAQKEHFLAVEAQRDRAEFEKVSGDINCVFAKCKIKYRVDLTKTIFVNR